MAKIAKEPEVATSITVEMDELVELGTNIRMITVGNLLVLVVDLDQDNGPSSSGKLNCIGQTGGFKPWSWIRREDQLV